MKKVFLLFVVTLVITSCAERVLMVGINVPKFETEQLYIDSHNNLAVVYRDAKPFYLSRNAHTGEQVLIQVPFYRVPYIKKLPMKSVVPPKD